MATSRDLASLSQATKQPDSGRTNAIANDEYPYRKKKKNHINSTKFMDNKLKQLQKDRNEKMWSENLKLACQ